MGPGRGSGRAASRSRSGRLGLLVALVTLFESLSVLLVFLLQPPRAHRGWQLIQAVDFGPACPQPVRYTGAAKGIRDMDEDCLYLNVYSRTVRPQKEQHRAR